MNERDRMIELLRAEMPTECDKYEDCIGCPYEFDAEGCFKTLAVSTADHLIANNVTIPPVSVGQTVYIIRRPTERPAWIDECEITYISVHYFKDGKSAVFSGYNFEVAECDIGKTVFLTREEAEEALREVKQ